MDNKIKRIGRLGYLNWYGYSQYIQKVEKNKLKTNEKSEVFFHSAIEMPDGTGQRINYLVGDDIWDVLSNSKISSRKKNQNSST